MLHEKMYIKSQQLIPWKKYQERVLPFPLALVLKFTLLPQFLHSSEKVHSANQFFIPNLLLPKLLFLEISGIGV